MVTGTRYRAEMIRTTLPRGKCSKRNGFLTGAARAVAARKRARMGEKVLIGRANRCYD
jgi:hypothetical protein